MLLFDPGAASSRVSQPFPRVPLTPRDGWLIHGCQVLRFRPIRWERDVQLLEITTGEWLPWEPIPLLKKRKEVSREEALKLWSELRQKGWLSCSPQW
jgi:hypothetical protein